ncbi:tetratricopeptide repeat protein [Thalassoglobus sp.]|uniref:tetratricopeptide repeat protein n=1 Tax=Thalassoglobus sp. TaxID=2795869 RepID=UPI003AA9A810
MIIEYKKHKNSWQRIAASTLIAGAITLSGCGSLSLFSHRAVADDQPDAKTRSPLAKIMGPTERGLKSVSFTKETESVQGGTEVDLQMAYQELKEAQLLFDNGRYADAEKAFNAIVKQRRVRYETAGSRFKDFWGMSDLASKDLYNNFGDPVEEDALYMRAEAQFHQRKFTRAQDSYDDLLNRYPSTRHMDRVTKQLFRIARYWLDFPNDLQQDKKAKSEIQLASKEEIDSVATAPPAKKPAWDLPIIPNLTDKTRPIYDADGRGLQALRSIWLHDATGPLADDSLMLAANHNLRTKNFVEAKRLYELLRDQYPDSPHLKDSYLLGSHVTLASYEGPEYDGAALDRARDLKQTMLQIFPEMTAEERGMLQSEIDQLHNADIDRLWQQVIYYQAKNVPESIALHCHLIINRYPNSQQAQKAREVLRELEAKSNRSGNSLWVWGSGQKPAPAQSAPRRTHVPDARMKATPDSARTAPGGSASRQPSNTTKPEEDEKSKRSIFGFLRKADEPPQLKPTPSEEQPGRVEL